MVAHGHPWLSIKQYTLSEIGTFFKTIVLIERSKKAQDLSDAWQANNLSHEGLVQTLKGLGVKPQRKVEEPSVAEVNQDWSRLKTFMSGRT